MNIQNFYQINEDEIVYVCEVLDHGIYVIDKLGLHRCIPNDSIGCYTIRKDIRDFPDASDPRLPYTFDLYWDIKLLSEYVEYSQDIEDEAKIFGIDLSKPETVREYNLRFTKWVNESLSAEELISELENRFKGMEWVKIDRFSIKSDTLQVHINNVYLVYVLLENDSIQTFESVDKLESFLSNRNQMDKDK